MGTPLALLTLLLLLPVASFAGDLPGFPLAARSPDAIRAQEQVERFGVETRLDESTESRIRVVVPLAGSHHGDVLRPVGVRPAPRPIRSTQEIRRTTEDLHFESKRRSLEGELDRELAGDPAARSRAQRGLNTIESERRLRQVERDLRPGGRNSARGIAPRPRHPSYHRRTPGGRLPR
jgi:hypothetical protein